MTTATENRIDDTTLAARLRGARFARMASVVTLLSASIAILGLGVSDARPISGVPSKALLASAFRPHRPGLFPTLLSPDLRVRGDVTLSELDAWKRESASPDSDVKARALVRLAEVHLGLYEDPLTAEYFYSEALALRPTEPSVESLARFGRAMSLYHSGRYRSAQRALKDLLASNRSVIGTKAMSLWESRAESSAAYHEDHAKQGIRQPPVLDPMAGAAGIAITLDKLGIPYTRKDVEQTVPHTGLGSSMSDIVTGAGRFGLSAVPIELRKTEAIAELLRVNGGMPVIALVEHDHYVTVVRADKGGVTYLCTDCGPWPGGEQTVTWKQWRIMEPVRCVLFARPGSRFETYIKRKSDSQGAIPANALGPIVPNSNTPDIAFKKLEVSLKGVLCVIDSAATFQKPQPLSEPHCLCPDACPLQGPSDGSGVGSSPEPNKGGPSSMPKAAAHGPSSGDPVNLANGEEEYVPAPDMVVYNPKGPSVKWGPMYFSMMDWDSSFGYGWTHPYNFAVCAPYKVGNDWMPGAVIFPNSAYVPIHNESAIDPNVQGGTAFCSAEPGRTLYVEWRAGNEFTVTFGDGSCFVTEEGLSIGFHRPLFWYDKAGNFIEFNYGDYAPYGSGSTVRRLEQIRDSDENPLITFDLDSYGNITCATDKDGRKVYYEVANHAASGGGLDYTTYWGLEKVSQIQSGSSSNPPDRYVFGYENYHAGGSSYTVPYLSSITVPTPTGATNGSGQLLTETTEIDYFSNGKVETITDANGNKSCFDYGSGTTDVELRDPSDEVVYEYQARYNTDMMCLGFRNGTGTIRDVVEYEYNDAGNRFRPSKVIVHYDNTAESYLTREWTYDWNAKGRLLESTTPSGISTTYTWGTDFYLGRLTSVQTHKGSSYLTSTDMEYYPDETSESDGQPDGFLEKVSAAVPGQTYPASKQDTTFTYHLNGNVVTVTAPGNNTVSTHVTTYGYTTDGNYSQNERLGEPITVSTNKSSSVTTTHHLRWDTRHNVTNSTDPSGIETVYEYLYTDQLESVTLPVQTTGSSHAARSMTYLYPGGPLKKVEHFGPEDGTVDRTVNYTYGKEGHVLSVSGNVETTTVTYDPMYRTATFKDGEDNVTSYTYDVLGNLTQVDYPLATGTDFDRVRYTGHDKIGQVLSMVDGVGQEKVYTYGAGDTDDGMLTGIAYTGLTGKDVEVEYDNFDRAVALSDSSGTASASYDDLGNVLVATRDYGGPSVNPPSQTFEYSYYADGSRYTMENAAGTWTYGYDGNGQCTSLHSPADVSSTGLSVTHYANGWEDTRTLPNGCYSVSTWDNLGLPYSVTNKDSGGSTRSAYGSFAWDPAFNLTARSCTAQTAGQLVGGHSWTYDSKGRLTYELYDQTGSGTDIGYDKDYAYDDAGNPTTYRDGSQAFNADDQRSATGFAFDGNGSPTTYAGATMAWDEEARLKSVSSTGAYRWYGNRSDGLRAWKDSATSVPQGGGTPTSTAKYFYYDGGKPVLETDASGTVTAINVFAPDGLVARWGGSSWRYYQFDQQGSVVHRLKADGTLDNSSMYECYGQYVNVPQYIGADCWRWNGRWGYVFDTETGLYLCGLRYYDAGQGRWLNRDPIGYDGGANLYGYCGGNPVGLTDPDGMSPLSPYDLISAPTLLSKKEAEISGAGVMTGFKNLGEGLIDLGRGLLQSSIIPLPDVPNPLRNSTAGEPGWEESRWFANLGINCASLAAGLKGVSASTGQYGTFIRYPNAGGGGFNWRQGPGWGQRIWSADWHRWGKPPGKSLPHLDVPKWGWEHWPWK